MANIEEAIRIAAKGLRWCYRENGIISGSRLVYWSWDSFFASLGALTLGDQDIVKKNLSYYLKYQNEEGLLPKRIANPYYIFRFIGIPIRETPERQKPNYWNSYYTAPSLTQNPTFIIALHAYLESTDDWEFAKANYPKLKRILKYLENNKHKHGLLKEGLGGGWAESVLKRGAVAFTNVCYARSLECMHGICLKLEHNEDASYYHSEYIEVKNAINRHLWFDQEGGYYSDWVGYRRHHYFATDGNLLAIWWGIADSEKALKIQTKIKDLHLEGDVPIRLAYDRYSYWRIFIMNRIGGIKDYHVGFSWTWLGCIDVMVKIKLGQRKEALNTLERIAEVICRDKTVHEIYQKGKAVQTMFYKSENPWAWGSGLFLLACYKAGYKLND